MIDPAVDELHAPGSNVAIDHRRSVERPRPAERALRVLEDSDRDRRVRFPSASPRCALRRHAACAGRGEFFESDAGATTISTTTITTVATNAAAASSSRFRFTSVTEGRVERR